MRFHSLGRISAEGKEDKKWEKNLSVSADFLDIAGIPPNPGHVQQPHEVKAERFFFSRGKRKEKGRK